MSANKKQCLVCRLGSDCQKVETVELVAREFTSGAPASSWLHKLGVRIPVCRDHRSVAIELLTVHTGEGT